MKILKIILLFPPIAITVFIVYLYISAHSEEEKTYYFPQVETYMKVYKPVFNCYGYAIFSKDSIFSYSENSDFIRIYKSETSQVNLIFNPLDSKKIYVEDRWNNTKINQVNFDIKRINREDTTFFEQEYISGLKIQIPKPQYFEVFIEGYLQSVFYVDYKISESPIRAIPLKIIRTKE
ncbi:MAG: hypothetical protein IKN94_05675 [Salinivirgaceae bacterium]|nr:hypothetical protein [Salinivirgaceae bacterium]